MTLAVIYVVTVHKRSEERRVWLGCAPITVAGLAGPLEAEHFVVSGGVAVLDPTGRVKCRPARDGSGRLMPDINDEMMVEAHLTTTCHSAPAARNARAIRRGDLIDEDAPAAAEPLASVETLTLHDVLGDEAVAEPGGEKMAWSLRTLRMAHAFYAQECRGRKLSLKAMARALLPPLTDGSLFTPRYD
jgi:hypothetical protein